MLLALVLDSVGGNIIVTHADANVLRQFNDAHIRLGVYKVHFLVGIHKCSLITHKRVVSMVELVYPSITDGIDLRGQDYTTSLIWPGHQHYSSDGWVNGYVVLYEKVPVVAEPIWLDDCDGICPCGGMSCDGTCDTGTEAYRNEQAMEDWDYGDTEFRNPIEAEEEWVDNYCLMFNAGSLGVELVLPMPEIECPF